jgi:hypothetical protein
MKRLVFLVLCALALGSETWPPVPSPAPLAGFSYSPLISEWAGRSPTQDLTRLLDETNPDLVRLPIYWEDVEPDAHTIDFSIIQSLLDVVGRHNAHSSVQTRVVLTIGARNFLYPELHMPAWAGPRSQPNISRMQAGSAYHDYFDGSVLRYRGSPLLYAWQVENEPLDYVPNVMTGDDQIGREQIAWEIAEVHRLDPSHKVLTTTFDGWNSTIDMLQICCTPLLWLLGGYPSGHPDDMLTAGDALGLDIYLDGPTTPMRLVSGISLRTQWKEQALGFWTDRARSEGKQVWVAEMQAQPWGGVDDFTPTFSPADLLNSAADYRRAGVSVVLLWGVDSWLYDPTWMAAGAHAMEILRSR